VVSVDLQCDSMRVDKFVCTSCPFIEHAFPVRYLREFDVCEHSQFLQIVNW